MIGIRYLLQKFFRCFSIDTTRIDWLISFRIVKIDLRRPVLVMDSVERLLLVSTPRKIIKHVALGLHIFSWSSFQLFVFSIDTTRMIFEVVGARVEPIIEDLFYMLYGSPVKIHADAQVSPFESASPGRVEQFRELVHCKTQRSTFLCLAR